MQIVSEIKIKGKTYFATQHSILQYLGLIPSSNSSVTGISDLTINQV